MAEDSLGDIRLFVEAAALGSLSAAGRKLGYSAAAASARLTKLEASLQAKLFDRTTRSLRLTNEGHVYMQHCRVALEALENARAALLAGQEYVRGKVRISASTDFGRHLLNRWLEEFSVGHPQLQLALTLTDSLSNLLEDDMDLAVRFGKPAARRPGSASSGAQLACAVRGTGLSGAVRRAAYARGSGGASVRDPGERHRPAQ